MDRWPLLECAQPHAPFLSAKLTHHAPGTHKTHIRRWCVIKCVFFLRVFNRCPSAEIAEPFFFDDSRHHVSYPACRDVVRDQAQAAHRGEGNDFAAPLASPVSQASSHHGTHAHFTATSRFGGSFRFRIFLAVCGTPFRDDAIKKGTELH